MESPPAIPAHRSPAEVAGWKLRCRHHTRPLRTPDELETQCRSSGVRVCLLKNRAISNTQLASLTLQTRVEAVEEADRPPHQMRDCRTKRPPGGLSSRTLDHLRSITQ